MPPEPDSPGAGAPEVKVTDDMALAGADLISRHFGDVTPWPYQVSTLASEVYRAMERQRLRSLSAPPVDAATVDAPFVERVARALKDTLPNAGPWTTQGWPWEALARAAIKVMRDPTKEMCAAAIDTGAVNNDTYYVNESHITRVWQAMIDEAVPDASWV